MGINWKHEIVTLVYIKQELASLDVRRIYPHHLPKLSASSENLKLCEAELGFRFAKDHAEFLLCANGWNGFIQTIDLFGLEDFCNGSKFQSAFDLLDAYEPLVFSQIGLKRSSIFPIAASSLDGDIFVQVKPTWPLEGHVFWLAGYMIEKFESFSDFFLSMMDYNRLVVKKLQAKN